MVKKKQLDFFTLSKKKELIANKRLEFVKKNIAAQKLIAKRKKEEVRKQTISTKISAYNLAWKIIESGNPNIGYSMVNEAWHIVKVLSPAKGKNKIGARAKFKRVRGASVDDPKEMELKKLSLKQAQKFIKIANETLKYGIK